MARKAKVAETTKMDISDTFGQVDWKANFLELYFGVAQILVGARDYNKRPEQVLNEWDILRQKYDGMID